MKRPLNIAIEAIPISNTELTGIGKVVLHYLNELQGIDTENNYCIITKEKLEHVTITNPRWKSISYINNDFYFRNWVRKKWLKVRDRYRAEKKPITFLKLYFLRAIKVPLEISSSIFFHIWLLYTLKKEKIDVYLCTSTVFFPNSFLNSVKKIFFIYDLVWKFYPETMEPGNRILMRFYTKRYLQKADLLVSISESTKRDFIQNVDIKNKIDVIPLAADKHIFYKAKITDIKNVRQKYNINKKYILSVCTLEPRKNLDSLLQAFARIEDKDIQLVLVGKLGWIRTNFFERIKNLGIDERLLITGYVPESDLAPIYSGASLFVYLSLYEGFGLPVLEAMQCGCPVIVSNNSSIPEVAGNAGIKLDALSIEETVNAINKILYNNKLKNDMSHKGLLRAETFSWEISANKLLKKITTLYHGG